jgi:hypothetical protein
VLFPEVMQKGDVSKCQVWPSQVKLHLKVEHWTVLKNDREAFNSSLRPLGEMRCMTISAKPGRPSGGGMWNSQAQGRMGGEKALTGSRTSGESDSVRK